MPVAKPRLFLANKGYDSDALREELLIHGVRPVIPPRANGKDQPPVTSQSTWTEIVSSGCSTG